MKIKDAIALLQLLESTSPEAEVELSIDTSSSTRLVTYKGIPDKISLDRDVLDRLIVT